ncbi:MAG TPA: hypothetical protein VEB64_00730 [Azospirillaceae bacterium]|nr:hypothetical protein [Azospirillaceae bacterium]
MVAMPDTMHRVERYSPPITNRRIRKATEERVSWHAAHPEAIDRRLWELDQEWDIERVLETNAAGLSLGGLILAATVDRRWLVLPMTVAAFLLQHAIQGWCPPVEVFRRRGVRTAAEIDEERFALKALRGDFDSLPAIGGHGHGHGPEARAQAALEAVRRGATSI